MARIDKYTPSRQQPVYYADFLSDFSKNPVTGALAIATNEDAIKNSIKSLVLTEKGERFYTTRLGSKIYSLLFEPFSPSTVDLLDKLIRDTIKYGEPRAIVNNIRITEDIDNNGIYITIVFSIINIPNESILNIFISRVR